MGGVRGVVWDFGGVLVDWDPFPAVAAGVGEDAARAFFDGFDFGAWNYACDAGRTWDEALAILERDHPELVPAGKAYRANFDKALVGEIPGTHAIVRHLHRQRFRQFGLTNWSDELYHAYAPQRFETLTLLEDVVVSGTVRLAKPDPAIYRLAGERSGLPLSSLVFVDDSPKNVEAARAAGMHALHFTDADALRADLQALGVPA